MYVRYKSDALVIGENISFVNLKAAIAAKVGWTNRERSC